uniref:Uncharacterized protein n=1 Tax=Arundo donax TaxID=35708 RepID=A0A0A9G142_ARUDO
MEWQLMKALYHFIILSDHSATYSTSFCFMEKTNNRRHTVIVTEDTLQMRKKTEMENR